MCAIQGKPNTNLFNHVVVVRHRYHNIHGLSPMANHVQSLQDYLFPSSITVLYTFSLFNSKTSHQILHRAP